MLWMILLTIGQVDTACQLDAGAEDHFKACVCSTGPNNTCTTADKAAAKALAEAQLGTHWCFDNSCTGPCKADSDCTVEDHIRSHDDADACPDTDWLCCYRFSNCTRTSDCNCTQVGGGGGESAKSRKKVGKQYRRALRKAA